MILTILVVAICVLISAGLVKLAFWYWNSYCILLRSQCFRGPKAFPLIGNSHLFIGNTADIYERIQILIRKFRSPFRVWLGPRLLFVLHDPEQIKLILTNPNAIEKDRIYDVLNPFLGQGLLTASASRWKPHRKIIQPLFNTKVLESFIQVFATKALIAAEKMGMEEQGREFDVYKYMSRYSFDSICETTMGLCFNALSNEDCPYLHMVESILEITVMRMVKPWLYPDFIFSCTSIGRKHNKCIKYIHEFTQNVLNGAKEEVQEEIEIQRRKYLTSLLLRSTDGDYKFTDEEIRDEIATVITAGYETTANLLSYAMFILANYPEIQDKVYAEVREIYGECNSGLLNVTLQDLNRMEYLDRVLKETLRLFPGGVLLARYLSDAVNIGEYTLPAGSSVVFGFFEIHRSEEHWPQASEFNPDRFLPKHPLGPRHPYAYIPFSSGPRNCIGMKYAIMSAKIIISTLISRYIIKTRFAREVKDVEMKMNITLKPKYPIMVSTERRPVESS